MTDKLKIDMSTMSYQDMIDASEMSGSTATLDSLSGVAQLRYVAALVCITMRRTDPTFSFEQALAMRPSQVELVDSSSEQSAGSNGAGPALLPASGT